jgi:hypothetical protein
MLTSKFKSSPGLLSQWFDLLQAAGSGDNAPCLADLPLVYLLLEFSVHDNPVGEYARMGIVYVVEALPEIDSPLVRWFTNSSGLAAALSSGLGAMYSQISRPVNRPESQSRQLFRLEDPPIVTLAGNSNDQPKDDLSIAQSHIAVRFQRSLDEFISYLLFWKDLVNNCKSPALRSNLLEHYDVYFVRQLLYPSVAAGYTAEREFSHESLTILRLILDSLGHCPLSQLVLTYFLRLPIGTAATMRKDTAIQSGLSAQQQPSSLEQMEMEMGPEPACESELRQPACGVMESGSSFYERIWVDNQRGMEELLTDGGLPVLTLKDILYVSLESKSETLRVAALQLMITLVRCYFHYLPNRVFEVETTSDTSFKEWDGIKEAREYDRLGRGVSGSSYSRKELHEEDAEARFEAADLQPRGKFMVLPEELERRKQIIFLYASIAIEPKSVKIRFGDPLMGRVLKLLGDYLTNGVELNLVLGAFLFEFSSCLWCNLDGWVLDEKAGTPGRFLSAFKKISNKLDAIRSKHNGAFALGLRSFEAKLSVGDDLSDAIFSSPMEAQSLRCDYMPDSHLSSPTRDHSPTGTSLERLESDSNDSAVNTGRSASLGVAARLCFNEGPLDNPVSVTNTTNVGPFALGAPPNLDSSGIPPRLFANAVLFREIMAHLAAVIRVRRFMNEHKRT